MHTHIHTSQENRLVFRNAEVVPERASQMGDNAPKAELFRKSEQQRAEVESAATAFAGRLSAAPNPQGRALVVRSILESDQLKDTEENGRNALINRLAERGALRMDDITPFINDASQQTASRALSATEAVYRAEMANAKQALAGNVDQSGREAALLAPFSRYLDTLVTGLQRQTTDAGRKLVLKTLMSPAVTSMFGNAQAGRQTLQDSLFTRLETMGAGQPASSLLANAATLVRDAINAETQRATAEKADAANRSEKKS